MDPLPGTVLAFADVVFHRPIIDLGWHVVIEGIRLPADLRLVFDKGLIPLVDTRGGFCHFFFFFGFFLLGDSRFLRDCDAFFNYCFVHHRCWFFRCDLRLDTPHTYTDCFNKAFEFKPVGTIGNASVEGNSITLSGKDGLSFVDMGELPQTMMMTCTFTVDSYFSQVGLCFGTNSVSEKSSYIMLNAANNRIQFDAATLGNIGEAPPSSGGFNANSYESFTFEPGKEYTLKVVVEDEIIALYVNGEKMLINCNFDAVGMDFGFFASRNGVTFKDIEIFVTDSVTAQPGVPTSKRDISKTPAKDTETSTTVTMKPAETTKREETMPDTTITEPDGSADDTIVPPFEKSNAWLPVALVLGAVAIIAGGVSAVIRSRKKKSFFQTVFAFDPSVFERSIKESLMMKQQIDY